MINRPHGSKDYLLLFVKTESTFVIGKQEIHADKNSFILFDKETPQKYYARGTQYSNDFIHFEVDGEHDIRKLPLNTLLKLPAIKPITKILKEIYLEYISNNICKSESMDLLLRLLFLKINELVAYQLQDNVLYGHYDILLELRSEIYRHPELKWSVERLSRHVNLSPSYFQRLYKQTFGVTCIADVITCKIEYAKFSLSSTVCTVREISIMCGYENYEHFMRQFKQAVGVTPTQYRKQLNNM